MGVHHLLQIYFDHFDIMRIYSTCILCFSLFTKQINMQDGGTTATTDTPATTATSERNCAEGWTFDEDGSRSCLKVVFETKPVNWTTALTRCGKQMAMATLAIIHTSATNNNIETL